MSETADAVWPFAPPDPMALAQSRVKVWANYFPPLPLSLDNWPAKHDYYQDDATRRYGERGRYVAQGGYLRTRPLPVGPWATPAWRQVNAAIDLLRVVRIGGDGFVLNLNSLDSDGQLHDFIEALCDAADWLVPGIRLIASPDMASLHHATEDQISKYLYHLALTHKNLYRLDDGRLVVAPFAPDYKTPNFWASLAQKCAAKGQAIAVLPIILDWGKFESFLPISAGISNWGVRELSQVTSLADQFSALSARVPMWMMPIAPQDARPNSSIFWEAANTRLFRKLWAGAIAKAAPAVHIITWNDYSETTQIEPSIATQFVFYDLAAYFIATYKLGKPPLILRDTIYYMHRQQIVRDGHSAMAGDRPMHRVGHDRVLNEVELLAFLTAPATLEIVVGEGIFRSEARAGLAELHAPAAPGRPRFRIIRNDVTVVEKVSDWVIVEDPERDDYTYYGGSSNRRFVTVGDSG